MFHSREFHAPVMSPFFRPYQSFDDIILDKIRPYFSPLRYPTDGESDSDTHLTPIVSLDSDPSEPSIRAIMWSLTHPSLLALQ